MFLVCTLYFMTVQFIVNQNSIVIMHVVNMDTSSPHCLVNYCEFSQCVAVSDQVP